MERILYHLMWVVGGWLVKKLKIAEKLSGSATIFSYVVRRSISIVILQSTEHIFSLDIVISIFCMYTI